MSGKGLGQTQAVRGGIGMTRARAGKKPVFQNRTAGKIIRSATVPNKGFSLQELILIGVGGIIGAGFFLGSGLPIQTAGPAVLISFVIGGLLTAQVTGALTTLAIQHPVEGSFKVFAELYLGKFAGYMQGWVYYIASVLTIASEAVAMGVFTRVWLPTLPLWVPTLTYSILILAINAFGVKSFGAIESLMSLVKIAALTGFILFVALFLLSGGSPVSTPGLTTHTTTMASAPLHGFFPHGFSGVLQAMLVVVFAYAGIGVFATAAAEVDRPRTIQQGALWTLIILSLLYLLSIGSLLLIQPWYTVSTTVSPFVLALQHQRWPLLAQALNAVILVASFSVMAGSVFSANQILTNLAQSGEAPHRIAHVSRQGLSYGALAFTAIGIGVVVLASFLLPGRIYDLLISATGFLSFFYWFGILWTFLRWRNTAEGRQTKASILAFAAPYGSILTMGVLLAVTGYALIQPQQRTAFYGFVVLVFLLAASYLWVKKNASPATNSTPDSP
ncbi:amino acid permease [Alicyclobacillaceae bacterium I2511]|nr:amino acid permease [Alicyclobacillaceae bacterium I2511]